MDTSRAKRPISPHIQIYRWQWGSVYSILHRATGVALANGLLLVTLWVFAMYNPWLFSLLQPVTFSLIGKVLLTGLVWACFFHLFNGVRHLFWDMGMGFPLPRAQLSGNIVFILSLVATIACVIWALR